MNYISTRGEAPVLSFDDVLLAGLARDGGLYLPESWPQISPAEIAALAGRPYAEVVGRVVAPFMAGSLAESDIAALAGDSYAGFDHAAVAPLKQLDERLWLMELFHGPTLAFKDIAMQLLGRLFDHVLNKRGERITIIGATSGDTGSAAIEACRDRDAIEIFMLYPDQRVSEVQRRQMTTVDSPNVHTIAVQGTFDDCQDLVKAMFSDVRLRNELRLSAVNSINWARIMAQIAYYFHAAVALGAPDRGVTFVVPTGNFGDIYAGYAAHRMGLPVSDLVVATNRNDILARFFESAEYRKDDVHPTMSPSMDIQVSSNFERLLFEGMGRDGTAVAALMSQLDTSGGFRVGDTCHTGLRRLFSARAVGEDETLSSIAATWRENGILIDPHTAVGMAAPVSSLGSTGKAVMRTRSSAAPSRSLSVPS